MSHPSGEWTVWSPIPLESRSGVRFTVELMGLIHGSRRGGPRRSLYLLVTNGAAAGRATLSARSDAAGAPDFAADALRNVPGQVIRLLATSGQ